MRETFSRLLRGRALIATLARRELKARYRGGFLGFFWSILNPLLQLAVYSVVFTLVFAPRADVRPYALFLFGGVLAWNFLSSSLLDSAETFRQNGPLLRKVIVPPEIFPAVSVVAQGFHLLLALPVLVGASLVARVWFGGYFGWAALQAIPILLLFVLAVLGAALFCSAVSVHFRDLRDLLQSVLMFWFFASPVLYPLASVPPRLARVLLVNPATPYLEGLHEALFYGKTVPLRLWAGMALVAALAAFVGGTVFHRLRDSIPEEA